MIQFDDLHESRLAPFGMRATLEKGCLSQLNRC